MAFPLRPACSSTWDIPPKKSVNRVSDSGRGNRSDRTPAVECMTSNEKVSNCATIAALVEDISVQTKRERAYQVLQGDLGRLVDGFEKGEDMMRISIRDCNSNIVIGVMLYAVVKLVSSLCKNARTMNNSQKMNSRPWHWNPWRQYLASKTCRRVC